MLLLRLSRRLKVKGVYKEITNSPIVNSLDFYQVLFWTLIGLEVGDVVFSNCVNPVVFGVVSIFTRLA